MVYAQLRQKPHVTYIWDTQQSTQHTSISLASVTTVYRVEAHQNIWPTWLLVSQAPHQAQQWYNADTDSEEPVERKVHDTEYLRWSM